MTFNLLYHPWPQVKEQFHNFDADNDGYITSDEMIEGMTKNKDFTKEQAKFAFSCADVNEDNKIDIAEFVQLFFPSAKEVNYCVDTFPKCSRPSRTCGRCSEVLMM